MTDPILLAVLFVVPLLVMYVFGVHVAFALGLVSALVMLLGVGPMWTVNTFANQMYSSLNSFTLLAIPFFLFAGRMMNSIGLTDDIFDFAEALVRPLPGGLGHVNVVVSIIFSGMSGAAVADAAGLGSIEYEAMTSRGYDGSTAAGITGASSTIGPIIPPSIPIIVYGVTAQVSIGALFLAGIVPGLVMGLGLMAFITVGALRSGTASVESFSLRELFESSVRALPGLIAPAIIIGGIATGLFTPTEAAAVAGIYAVALGGLYYRNLDPSTLWSILGDTFEDTAVLTLIIAFANVYGFVLTISGLPTVLTEQLLTISSEPTVLLLLFALFFLILGTFMETIAIIMIVVPIVAPILPQIGIDPIHFGIVMMVALMIGLISPPFGVVLFALERVTDLDIEDIIRGIIPYYVPLLGALVLLILFPSAVLAVPRYFGLV
ncbi:TRAP transporter large permease [Haloterrigena salifodinae]|uniref:TRAP transporter large permease n=1 Tax=Haloterrigena salifodinae TaxID=2675099 RepID=A0A8T8E7G7_9EURY|nr:TRAP transporter large permease [Haloterrigena salifodinae]QRV17668.1 TRAP transporter large permease [Haloterrigena salifodinae]